jgi:hypothetical protein
LLNVRPLLHGDVSSFIDRENIKQCHQEEGVKGLQSARDLLEQAGIVCQPHILVGDLVGMIVHCATEKIVTRSSLVRADWEAPKSY